MSYAAYHKYHARVKDLQDSLSTVQARLEPIEEQYRELKKQRKKLREAVLALKQVAENELMTSTA